MRGQEYMESVYDALKSNYSNMREFYDGKKGALRLAREFGYGLNFLSSKEQKNILSSSYSFLCVRFYDLRPPIDAKEWIDEMLSQIKN